MKKFSVIMGLLLCCLMGRANPQALQITLLGGDTETFVLSEKPVVTFSGENMTVTSPLLSSTYLRADVQNMTFVEAAGVKALPGHDTVYRFAGNIFSCEGALIRVFSTAGAQVAAGTGSVSLQELPAGVYVINANNKSIKVIKK